MGQTPTPQQVKKELATDNNVVTKSGKDNNVITIGDKIRESNESLAEFIDKIQMAPQQPVYDTLEYILDYLNQPYTES